MDVDNCSALIADRFRTEIKRGIQQIGIIGNIDDIADDLLNCIFRNADNFSIIGYTKNCDAKSNLLPGEMQSALLFFKLIRFNSGRNNQPQVRSGSVGT